MPQEDEIEQTAEDLKSSAANTVRKYSGRTKQVWEDAEDQVRTFKQDAEDYVRENPAVAVFTALGVGFVLGLLSHRR